MKFRDILEKIENDEDEWVIRFYSKGQKKDFFVNKQNKAIATQSDYDPKEEFAEAKRFKSEADAKRLADKLKAEFPDRTFDVLTTDHFKNYEED